MRKKKGGGKKTLGETRNSGGRKGWGGYGLEKGSLKQNPKRKKGNWVFLGVGGNVYSWAGRLMEIIGGEEGGGGKNEMRKEGDGGVIIRGERKCEKGVCERGER